MQGRIYSDAKKKYRDFFSLRGLEVQINFKRSGEALRNYKRPRRQGQEDVRTIRHGKVDALELARSAY